jgi:thioesterase domain-containing protein
LQEQLAGIWQEVLQVERVGAGDNFFDLGGYSMLAVRLLERIEREHGHAIALSSLYSDATIEGLVQGLLDSDPRIPDTKRAANGLLEIQPGGRQPIYFVHGDFYLGGPYCHELAAHLGADQPFYAFAQHGADGREVPPTIEAMASDHVGTLRAHRPAGPYVLGGMCNGGLIAYEMARQLQALGEQVDLVVIVDAAARRAGAYYDYPPVPISMINPDMLDARQRQARETYIRAVTTYLPGPYAGRVAVLWPREDDPPTDDPTLGWGRLAERVEPYLIAGSHLTCVAQHGDSLAQQLRACLDAIR